MILQRRVDYKRVQELEGVISDRCHLVRAVFVSPLPPSCLHCFQLLLKIFQSELLTLNLVEEGWIILRYIYHNKLLFWI